MHNYDVDINWLDIDITAAKIAVILTEDDHYKYAFPILQDFLKHIHPLLRKANEADCKYVKRNLLFDLSSGVLGKYAKIGNSHIRRIYDLDILSQEEKDNIAATMARWSEFYLISEYEMKIIGENLDQYLSEINAITYIDKEGNRICPYRIDVYHNDLDWEGTIYAQEKCVKEFLQNQGINTAITSEQIVQTMYDIFTDIDNNQPRGSLEEGFFDSIWYIRARIRMVEDRIRDYLAGHARHDDFTLSESKSPSSSIEAIMQTLHSLGWNKSTCPMVLDNLIHGQYKTLHIESQPGQIIVEIDFEGFDVAPGLGPGKKIRFVFNCHADIQNSISPLADLLQEADRFVEDFMEAYNDQLRQITIDMNDITDAFGTDATGYSDYLFRAIYTYLLSLYGCSDFLINYILSVFRMPLNIKGKKYKVEFGAMQGCKLLVFIMNQANRLIGIIARRLGKYPVAARSNAGDDTEVHRFEGCFTQADIDTEIATFAFFNCPCNREKSAWLKRDGYFDFCSRYFRLNENGKGIHSITGLPPKIAGKQIVCIGQFSEIFKVLDTSGTHHRSCKESWDLLLPLLRPDLEDGNKLPNIYREYNMTLDQKIQNAKDLWFEVGGLADEDNFDTVKSWELIRYKFRKMLGQYTFEPRGIFLMMNIMDDNFKKTELFKALGTVQRSSYGMILSILQIIDDVNNSIGLDRDDIREVYTKIMKLERDIIHGESISRNVSTYHRKTLRKDIDTFIVPSDGEEPAETKYQPDDLVSVSALVGNLTNPKYTDVDNIKNYIRLKILYDKYKGCIKEYAGFNYTPYLAIDEGDGLRVRLESKHSNYQYGQNFKWPEDIVNPEIYELYTLLTENGTMTAYSAIYELLYVQPELAIKRRLKHHLKNISEYQLDREARRVFRRLQRQGHLWS